MSDLANTIHSASGGDRHALEALLERYLPDLRAFARLNMGVLAHYESSADVVQSVCRQVLGDLDGFDYRGEPAFRSWLLVACTNRMRDHLKGHHRDKRDARRHAELRESVVEIVGELATPSGELIRREELANLERALDRMPDEYRRVVTLSRILGLSHAEIAVELGKSEGATRMLLHRALARLGFLMSEGEA